MLSPAQIRENLRAAVAAVVEGDAAGIESAQSWLTIASARDLLRIDGFARQWRYEGPTLGKSQQWTRRLLNRAELALALASMHPDGFVRERAVELLAESYGRLSDRMLALRLADHVEQVRERALREILSRTDLSEVDQIAAVLHRFEVRNRGAQARTIYLNELEARHGQQQLWAHLRGSEDRDLRRVAFRHSIEQNYLTVDEAVGHLEHDRDQIVRRLMANLIAETAQTEVIRSALLNSRVAEARVLALVKLAPTDLGPEEIEPLLADSSVLVRFWARRRLTEHGGDVTEACRSAIDSAPTPVRRANAYLGLSEAGAAIQRDELLQLVGCSDVPLQKVGLTLLKNKATAADTEMLFQLVAGEQSRIARLASIVLAENPGLWSLSDLATLKDDRDPVLRRRTWWLHRSRRGWESVIADLQIVEDPDPHLALLGRQPVAPMYSRPDERQTALIDELLRRSPLGRDRRLGLAHAVGLTDLVVELRQTSRWATRTAETPVSAAPEERPRPVSLWQRLRRRNN